MKFITTLLTAAITMLFTANVFAHCGTCGSEEEHHHDHKTSEGIKEYTEGSCCSKEHFMKLQKEAIADEAKAEFKEGSCCSAEHYASKKADAAAKEAYKKEYTKGSCCSADHYAEKKMKAESGE